MELFGATEHEVLRMRKGRSVYWPIKTTCGSKQ